jgi:hypothetical protein
MPPKPRQCHHPVKNGKADSQRQRNAKREHHGGFVTETESNGRRIEAEADMRLQQSLYPELRRVLCNYRHGILTLYGVVSSFYVRQIAQELVQGLDGIEVIDNQLVVAEKKLSPIPNIAAKSDGAGSVGIQEPELRKSLGDSLAGPAPSDAQAE